jgi:hypothetical protein
MDVISLHLQCSVGAMLNWEDYLFINLFTMKSHIFYVILPYLCIWLTENTYLMINDVMSITFLTIIVG